MMSSTVFVDHRKTNILWNRTRTTELLTKQLEHTWMSVLVTSTSGNIEVIRLLLEHVLVSNQRISVVRVFFENMNISFSDVVNNTISEHWRVDLPPTLNRIQGNTNNFLPGDGMDGVGMNAMEDARTGKRILKMPLNQF